MAEKRRVVGEKGFERAQLSDRSTEKWWKTMASAFQNGMAEVRQ
jgi:hypothetical protein